MTLAVVRCNRPVRHHSERPLQLVPQRPAWIDALSEREAEVLRHIARGESNAEIGAALFISPATVKTHVRSLLDKLDVRDRLQLAVAAYRSGFVRC